MKASRFNVVIPLTSGSNLVFNTFSDSRVVGGDDLVEAIEFCATPARLTARQKGYLLELESLGIVLHDDADENKQLEYWFQRLKTDTSTISVTILPTMACNMRCVYCFEQGAGSHAHMSESMAHKVCDWVIAQVDDVRPHTLGVTFFGGEPLLKWPIVELIAKELHGRLETRNTVLSIDMITNGLLLSTEVVDALKPLGLRWVKVTLDGDEETHNRVRPKKRRGCKDASDSGTYQEILRNLIEVRGRVPIIVGGNYDDTTKSSIPALLDDLVAKGFRREDFVKVAFKPILGFPGHESASSHQIEACTYSGTHVEDFFWLIGETEKRGFNAYRKIGLGPCDAAREHSVTIGPAGDLYKCAAMVGRREYSIGNVGDPPERRAFSPVNVAFMTADPWKHCGNCKFVPLCGGGCRLASLSQTGRVDAVACEREYFEKVSTRLVVEEVQANG